MRVLLVGHGRMGRLVESLAESYGAEIAGIVTVESPPDALASGDFGRVDVAIDFSLPTAVPVNLPVLAGRGINVVIGTTGWGAHEAELRARVIECGTAVIAASNFSVGMFIFRQALAEAAKRFGAQPEFGAWIHEAHHAAKLDAPSGTAISIRASMLAAGYARAIDVSSTRAGSIPGTHTVGFDGPAESVTFTHEVRDRAVFAHGALVAAKWIHGRRGWFGIEDLLSS
jgi:4-hydroxy-tetrahydrodipicolinate reductase